MKHLLGLQLWDLLKYAESSEVVRQKNKLFINLINKFRVGNIYEMLKSYSRQDLYMDLMKTIQKTPCICMQKMNPS